MGNSWRRPEGRRAGSRYWLFLSAGGWTPAFPRQHLVFWLRATLWLGSPRVRQGRGVHRLQFISFPYRIPHLGSSLLYLGIHVVEHLSNRSESHHPWGCGRCGAVVGFAACGTR